jgi:hypothetical protein
MVRNKNIIPVDISLICNPKENRLKNEIDTITTQKTIIMKHYLHL